MVPYYGNRDDSGNCQEALGHTVSVDAVRFTQTDGSSCIHFYKVPRDHQAHTGTLCSEERTPRVVAEGLCLPKAQSRLCGQVGRPARREVLTHKGIKQENPRKEKLCYQSIQIQQQRMRHLT